MTRIATNTHHSTLTRREPTPGSNRSRSRQAFGRQSARELAPAELPRAADSANRTVLGLGHVHLKVRSLDRSVPFYAGLLGLRLSERAGRYAFLATGDEHHSIALEEIGDWTVEPPRRATGVAHIAFEVCDEAAFDAVRRKLLEADLPLISRNNGISWTFRFKDPDRNEIEIYVDRRSAWGGTQRWGGRWYETPRREAKSERRIAALVA